jgi:hypothetical protein
MMALRGSLAFPADVSVTREAYVSRAWHDAQRRGVERFTHVLLEAQVPLLPRSGGSVVDEARWLRGRGIRTATMCHGSDIRSPSDHAAREPLSPFVPGLSSRLGALETITRRHRDALEVLRDEGVPAFVSTPDLLLDVPWATWVPVVVDPATWACDTPPLEREVPVVVHAPSHDVLKGTDLVEPVLRELEAQGRLVYRQASGLDRAQMRDLYREADVVLDQFRLGIYGVAACEALAAGRVVVSHVSEQVREAARQAAGTGLPVLEATPDGLRRTLLGVLEDRDAARAVARRGPDFVRRLHGGEASARALAPFLGVRVPTPSVAGEHPADREP